MIARAFKPVAWVAAVGSAALCCYMLSLQVASERAELAGLERRIVDTQKDIRALQTELGTRGRLSQLEQWNAEVLALSAPVSGQYLQSTLSLARFDARRPDPVASDVRLASAEAAPAAPTTAAPPLRLASAAAPVPAEPQPALIRRASLATPPAMLPQRAAAPVRGSEAPARSAIPARALLDESTLRDLGVESRSERDGGARN